MAALSEKIPVPSSILMLETLAARIVIIHELGFHSSSFEGDLELAINALHHSNLMHSSIGHLVNDTVLCKLITEFLILSCFSARQLCSTCLNQES